MNTLRKQLGFTLMELMIVVGIMAILAMAAIPAYQGYLATTRGNTHFQNYEEARRFVAAECAKAAAGGAKAKVVATLNNNGEKQAPGNLTQPAFAAVARDSVAAGQVGITGLTNDEVVPGTNVVVSLGANPANGVDVSTYPGHDGTNMPKDTTILCASN